MPLTRRGFIALAGFVGAASVLEACVEMLGGGRHTEGGTTTVNRTPTYPPAPLSTPSPSAGEDGLENSTTGVKTSVVNSEQELSILERNKDLAVFGEDGLAQLEGATSREYVEASRERLLDPNKIKSEFIISEETHTGFQNFPLGGGIDQFLGDQVNFINGLEGENKLELGQILVAGGGFFNEHAVFEPNTKDSKWNFDTLGMWPFWPDIRYLIRINPEATVATLNDALAAYRRFGYLIDPYITTKDGRVLDLVLIHEIMHVLRNVGDLHSYGNARTMTRSERVILPGGSGIIRRQYSRFPAKEGGVLKDVVYRDGLLVKEEDLYQTGKRYSQVVVPHPESIMSTLGDESFQFTPWEILNSRYNQRFHPRGAIASISHGAPDNPVLPESMTVRLVDKKGSPLNAVVRIGAGGQNLTEVGQINGSSVLNRQMLFNAYPHAFLSLNNSKIIMPIPREIAEIYGLKARLFGETANPEVTIAIDTSVGKYLDSATHTVITYLPAKENEILLAQAYLPAIGRTLYWHLGAS